MYKVISCCVMYSEVGSSSNYVIERRNSSCPYHLYKGSMLINALWAWPENLHVHNQSFRAVFLIHVTVDLRV